MSWHGETNPHFWPRNPPPRPPSEHQQPPPPPPEKKIRLREQPDHIRVPTPVEPVDHPQPLRPILRARLPDDPQGPARYHPGTRQRPQERPDPAGEVIVPPTSQDHWPMHPHESSEAHWPLHPHTQDELPAPRPQGPPLPVVQQPPQRWQPSRDQNLIYPSPHRTNAFTWFVAVLCIILWVAIILGGLLILIIYLVYRPRSPQFEITDASLNAAYLDMGYLLNVDLTLLLNLTNPNKKMNVDLNFVVVKLRYDNYLIANQYIEPFYAAKLEHKFARVEMVGSQIRLPALVTRHLVKQIQGNQITFELDGYFHARSAFGTIFRYSYWLYTHCKIITTGPPSGVVVFTKCITKR